MSDHKKLNTIRATYFKGGKWYEATVELSMNVHGLTYILGRKAATRPSRKASLHHGDIVVTAKDVKEITHDEAMQLKVDDILKKA